MAKSKVQKRDITKNLNDKLASAKSVIFTSYDRLTVKEGEELRNRLKKENNEYYAVKKTLLELALRENKLEGLSARSFGGRVAAAFAYEDEVSPAKIVGKFKKEHADKINFIAGFLGDKALSKEEVEALSELPSKLELQARLVGSLNAPLSGLVNVFAGSLRSLLYVLKAREEKLAQ